MQNRKRLHLGLYALLHETYEVNRPSVEVFLDRWDTDDDGIPVGEPMLHFGSHPRYSEVMSLMKAEAERSPEDDAGWCEVVNRQHILALWDFLRHNPSMRLSDWLTIFDEKKEVERLVHVVMNEMTAREYRQCRMFHARILLRVVSRFLWLHKRACVSANHPDRKRERGEFIDVLL